MIANLIQNGYFKQRQLEGRSVWVLATPVQVVVKASVLAGLKEAYPLHSETGGILYAYPVNKALVISRFTVLPNQFTGEQAKTSYKPLGTTEARNRVLLDGALPIRFHSHPVEIWENPYDQQPLTFFQKTSSADRHNSYAPFTVGNYTLVMPEGLLSADDRAGTDVRFYLYGGLIAPDSLKALLTSEKIYIYFSLVAIFLAYLFGSRRYAWAIFSMAAVASVAVFLLEKRPSGIKNAEGDLVISIT